MITPYFITLPWVHYLNFRPKKLYHAARFEKETKYYHIRLEQDLLEDWVITVCNGRIKSRLGQSRIIAFTNYPEAFEHFLLIAKKRNQRNYQLTLYQSDDNLYQNILLWVSFVGIPVSAQNGVTRTGKKQTRSLPVSIPSSQHQFQDVQQMSFAF